MTSTSSCIYDEIEALFPIVLQEGQIHVVGNIHAFRPQDCLRRLQDVLVKDWNYADLYALLRLSGNVAAMGYVTKNAEWMERVVALVWMHVDTALQRLEQTELTVMAIIISLTSSVYAYVTGGDLHVEAFDPVDFSRLVRHCRSLLEFPVTNHMTGLHALKSYARVLDESNDRVFAAAVAEEFTSNNRRECIH